MVKLKTEKVGFEGADYIAEFYKFKNNLYHIVITNTETKEKIEKNIVSKNKEELLPLIQKFIDEKKKITPYSFQDTHQEVIIHSGWEKGNSYRLVLEGTGDIFREFTQRDIPNYYIMEKINRIKRFLDGFFSSNLHPDDTYYFSFSNNKDKFQKMKDYWNEQPHDTKNQELAIKLNLAMLDGNFYIAKDIVKQIEDLRE